MSRKLILVLSNIALLLLAAAILFAIGVLSGGAAANLSWERKLYEQGHGEYVVDPSNGDTKFQLFNGGTSDSAQD